MLPTRWPQRQLDFANKYSPIKIYSLWWCSKGNDFTSFYFLHSPLLKISARSRVVPIHLKRSWLPAQIQVYTPSER